MKKIVYIVLPILIAVVIVTELYLPESVPIENFIRAAVMIAALVLIAYLAVASPETFSKLRLNIQKGKKSSAPMFRIPTADERRTAPDVGRAFRIPRSVSGVPIISGRSSAETAPPPKPLRMFGTAGIRGLINKDITPSLVAKIAQVYADHLGNKGRAAVGYDSRYGAEMLAMSASSGLMSRGVSPVDCGLIPTGGIAAFIVKSQLDGGILITGSHTPADMTGLIILKADGSYLDDGLAREIERRYSECDQKPAPQIPLELLGKCQKADDALLIYHSFLMSKVDKDIIASKHYRVLVDPANGPATLVFPKLLKELGCEAVFVNDELKPVPNRPAEPRRWNLAETAAKVKQNNCVLGIATDVDADRVLFIDEAGEIFSEDLIGAIFAREILGCGHTCVTPINSSGLIETVVAERQAKLHYCCIGQPATLKVVRELKADFSYEESGKYYFARDCLWPDGILASLKLLEIMARHSQPLSGLASGFARFHQVKHTVKCAPHLVERTFSKVKKLWAEQATENRLEDVTIDGLKRIYNDKAWLLIRKSGTEPLIRVYADAPTLQRAEELVRAGEDIVNKAMSK